MATGVDSTYMKCLEHANAGSIQETGARKWGQGLGSDCYE